MLISIVYRFIGAAMKSRPVHDLFFAESEQRVLKFFLSFTYGFAIGVLLHMFVFSIKFSHEWKLLLALVLCALFTCFLHTFIQFRCISVLFWFEMFGKAGRNLIKPVVIALIILGPVNNIITNGKEVARVLECTAFLTYNLTRTKFDLAIKPFTNAFAHMDESLSDVKKKFEEIRKVVDPIYQEVENLDDHPTRLE